jgi:hypothetical protein
MSCAAELDGVQHQGCDDSTLREGNQEETVGVAADRQIVQGDLRIWRLGVFVERDRWEDRRGLGKVPGPRI